MLFDFDLKKIELPNNKTIGDTLKIELERLLSLIQIEMDRWYSSYVPAMYSRTRKMRNALYVDDYFSTDGNGNQLTVSLKYNDDAFHESLWESTKVNVLYLSNYGYKVKRGRHKDIPYFGYRSYSGYIDTAIDEFNKSNYFKLKVALKKPDSIYK